jgi:hypothetical protein
MKRKKISQAYLRLQALNNVSQAFADAMCKANLEYIAERGVFTPAMEYLWDSYVAFARTYGKD